MARIDDEWDAEAAEETVVVDREAEAETLIVERGTQAASDDEVEGTLAVTRQRAPRRDGAAPRRDPTLPSTSSRRRGMTMPPVPAGYGREAVDAVGPGAVETYEPRELPRLEAMPYEFGGVEATRGDSTQLPSVARRARRTSLVVLAVFAASCVVSIVGLVALGVSVLG